MNIIKIRLLQEDDYIISYKWRNNPEIWKYTGKKPDKKITPEIEKEWIRNVLDDKESSRHAILVNNKYVGNIQLTNICQTDAEYHIFIGETDYWGKGVAFEASLLLLQYAQKELGLDKIYLYVSCEHLGAIKLYEKLGFMTVEQKNNTFKMEKKI